MEEQVLAADGAPGEDTASGPVVPEDPSPAAPPPPPLGDRADEQEPSLIPQDGYPPQPPQPSAPTPAGLRRQSDSMPKDSEMPADTDVFGTPQVGQVGKHKVS
jgi:hypothetical protein